MSFNAAVNKVKSQIIVRFALLVVAYLDKVWTTVVSMSSFSSDRGAFSEVYGYNVLAKPYRYHIHNDLTYCLHDFVMLMMVDNPNRLPSPILSSFLLRWG